MTSKVLVVEDDKGIADYLKEILQDYGYAITAVSSGEKALKYLESSLPDVMLLDIGLPGIDGYQVCRRVKKDHPDLPVIMLTAHDTPPEEVEGLNLGADDYIGKPFVVDELLARIKASLRRKSAENAKLKVGDLELDAHTFEVKLGGRPIILPSKEFKLLKYLMTNKERILTREMILNSVWMYSHDLQTRVVDVYMGYLRKKIDGGFKNKLIHSVRGFGYVIKE